MENSKNKFNGIKIFERFIKDTPDELSSFDYFTLLEHVSQSKIDKDLIINILKESKLFLI